MNTFCNVRTKVLTYSQLQSLTQGFGLGPKLVRKESLLTAALNRKTKPDSLNCFRGYLESTMQIYEYCF